MPVRILATQALNGEVCCDVKVIGAVFLFHRHGPEVSGTNVQVCALCGLLTNGNIPGRNHGVQVNVSN